MDVKAFEDNRWSTFSQKPEFRHRAALELIEGGRVLDFACGDGALLELLKERGVEAMGVDISDEAVAACKRKGLEAVLMQPGASWPFPDKSFDCVVMLDVLEHVYDPQSILNEARRVSKDFLLIGVPNFSSLPARLQGLFGNVPENNLPHKGHIYWFNYLILRRIIGESKLELVSIRMNSFSLFRAMSWAVRMAPNMLALSFVAKARIKSE
jgi:methionine biosynthesis protein MetW